MPHPLLADMPLIAILRGIRTDEVVDIGMALFDAGFRCMEIPLNSPDPLASIAALRGALDGKALVGAGTVLTIDQVAQVRDAGGQMVISPNANPAVITASKSAGLLSLPGVLTPTEAFCAIEAGADALKLFPADLGGPAMLSAIRAVLPPAMPVFPVGGVSTATMAAFVGAGAAGFGIGTALYRPGQRAESVAQSAAAFLAAWKAAHQPG